MARGAALGHWLLYLLLFAVPLTAIVGAWAEDHALTSYLGPIGPWWFGPNGSGHGFGAWPIARRSPSTRSA